VEKSLRSYRKNPNKTESPEEQNSFGDFLLAGLCAFAFEIYRTGRDNHHIFTAFRTTVNFAARTGKTIAARPLEPVFGPRFPAVFAGNIAKKFRIVN
jgi:hypothetical protein